ncbi:MAG: biopolymer transporter ExbD [Fibrobacterota bacterium]
MKQLSLLKNLGLPSDETEAEIDLDTSPIMNVLVILIPFLASVAVYTQLAVLNLSLPPNVGAGLSLDSGRPKLKLTVVLSPERLAITYGEKMLDSLPKVNGVYDYAGLAERLKARRASADLKDEAVVAVRDAVAFKYVVDVLDVCRESGFTKSGLAAAAEDPGTGK